MSVLFGFDASASVDLPIAEEVALIVAAQEGCEDAKMRLVRQYTPLIRSSAGKFFTHAPSADEDDLLSTAALGLMLAVEEYDPTKGQRLGVIASPLIVRTLSDTVADTNPFTVPERTASRFFSIYRAADFDVEAGARMASAYHMSEEVFRTLYRALVHTGSLEQFQDQAVWDLAPHPLTTPTEVADLEDSTMCEIAFSVVNDEEERICRLAYGFTDYRALPDAEIADRIGGSQSSVQRKRSRALVKMRKALVATAS